MNIEKSCGAVIFRRNGDRLEYLLLFQRRSRTWSFPKGHMEPDETREQTALREVFEETSLRAALLPGFMESLTYPLKNGNTKRLSLFLAAGGRDPDVRDGEIARFIWADRDEAVKLLPDVGYGALLASAERFVLALGY